MNVWSLVTLIMLGALVIVVYACGYIQGAKHTQRRHEEASERLLVIDPPERTPGLPTNVDGPPSEPRSPKWRAGQFKSGPPHAG